MNNKELLLELEEKFNKLKEESKLKVTLDELDNVFFIKDYFLGARYVSETFSRMLCLRIRDTFWNRIQLYHAYLMPSPYSIIDTIEQQVLTEEDKNDLNLILKEFMEFVHRNGLIGLNKDTNQETNWIENALPLWNKHLPKMIKINEKLVDVWKNYTPSKE